MQWGNRPGHWVVATVGLATVVGTAMVMAQKPPVRDEGRAGQQPAATAPAHRNGLAGAQAMSAAFKQVAKEATPGIVTIDTTTRPRRAPRNAPQEDAENPFENTPFGDMFRNDPRFREFFRNQPRYQPRRIGMASGFIIDPSGIIMTNAHVVEGADEVKVRLYDGREYVASNVMFDTRTDVAILRIKADTPLTALRLGNSSLAEVGEWVIAVGSPFGLDLTVTAGIISATGRGPGIAEREDFLQTDAAINPGNSGGPLLNLNGEVIGINTAISSRSGGYEGIGFAVPINMAKWVSDQLIGKGSVTRAWLGVGIQVVSHDLARQFGVPVGKGAIVTQVMPDSPAAAAKLEEGDIILKIDNTEVTSPRNLQGLVEQLQVNQRYQLLIKRGGKEMTVNVDIKPMPKTVAQTPPEREERRPSGRPETARFSDLGLEVTALTNELARQFGYKKEQGVLISSVEDDSPAALAGLREGMLIERVGDKRIKSPTEFREAIKDISPEKGILLFVRTARGSQFLVIKPEAPAPAEPETSSNGNNTNRF